MKDITIKLPADEAVIVLNRLNRILDFAEEHADKGDSYYQITAPIEAHKDRIMKALKNQLETVEETREACAPILSEKQNK